MPLWTFPLRSLAGRHYLRYSTLPVNSARRWRLPWRASRSYNTALQQNQPDDTAIAAPVLSTAHPQDSETAFVPYLGNSGESANVQLRNAPRIWLPRRQRARKSVQNAKTTTRKLAQSQSQIPSRAEVRIKGCTRGVLSHRLRERLQSRVSPNFQERDLGWRYLQALKFSRLKAVKKPLSEPLDYWGRQWRRIMIYYANKHRGKFHQPLLPTLDVQASEWVQVILDRLDSGQTTLSREDLSLETERRPLWVWQQIALWLLTYDQQQMIRFLLATHYPPYLPATYIEDSLLHLARCFEHSKDPEVDIRMQRLADTFCLLADRDRKDSLSFFNPFIRILIPYCSNEQMQRIYTTIKAHNVGLHPYTWLHLTTYFAKHDHFEQALETLLEAHKLGVDVNQYAFLSNCSTVLRRSSEQADGLRVCLRVVSTLVDIGVKLDGPITDIIMLNAVEAGDLKTAFSVYHSLKERGLKPTVSTFAVLLKGCKMNIDDVEMLNEIIRDAISNINVRNSEVVATEILHCLALHHSKHNPTTALNTITEAYAQLFDLRPLQKLALSLPAVSQQHPAADDLMLPTLHAMTFMIGASIQHTLTHGHKPKEIFPLYERWRELVEAGVPHLTDLATTDHLANVFLMAFIQNPKSLIHAARVVRDMQRPLPPSAGVEQCKPTVQSWSIFLHGFTRHGQIKLAEQVMNYMRSKGIEPNHVTWNTIMTGYARAQDVEGTARALRSMETAGMVWDAWAHGGLKALRDKRKLQERLEKSRLQQSLDFTDELKQGLGERLSKPGEVAGFGDSPAEIAEQGSYQPFG